MECAARGLSCPWISVPIMAPTLPARGQGPASLLESSVLRLHRICCCTQHWCRKPPISKTGPCICCTVLRKRTAWPAQPAQPTGPMVTGVYSDSPPRSTTWDELTSGPRLGATPGCGTSAMGITTAWTSSLTMISSPQMAPR